MTVRPTFGVSEVGRLMAALDWESTPLGPPESWPDALHRTVRMMLTSKQQMVLFWGSQYALLYNDVYLPVIGANHPDKLGRSLREIWGSELQQVLLPLLANVVDSGEALWAHDHPFLLNRHGFVEETYFDISYDPVPLPDGRVGGVLCLVNETTDRVLSRRRLRTLSELGAATAGAQQADEVAHEVARAVAGNPDDVPFAHVYLRDAGALRRAASTMSEHESGPLVPGRGTPAGKVTAEVLDTGKPVSASAAAFIGCGALPGIEVALVLPITSGGGVEGVLVAAVNPRYALPGAYRDFFDMLSASVSSSVANAQAHQRERRQVAAVAELDRAKTVRLHDGEVTADSREGQGSTFTVRLPFGRTATVVGAPERTSMVGLYLDEALQWVKQPAAREEPTRAPTGASVLVALVNALQDGFAVATAEGAVIEMNEAFATMFGYGPEGMPYPVPQPWWPDPVRESDDFQQVNAAFATIQLHGGGRFVLPLRHRDGQLVWAAVAAASVRGRDGQQQLFVVTTRDVTTEHLAAQRQTTLARFTERVSEARDVREVLDVGVAEFRDQWKARQAFAVSWSSCGQINLITGDISWATVDPGVRKAITAAHQSGELHASINGIAVPVQTGARAAVLWLDLERPSLSAEDRLLLTGLCEQLAHALARASAFDDQRAVAITLQRAILGPTDLPAGFAVCYKPAVGQLEVGGDWYDVVRLHEDRVGVVVGDCVGRGLGAAAVMGQLRSACRALLLQSHNAPSQVLAALDNFAALIPDARCTTLCCAIIDLATAQIRYSSAGHPPGLLVHLDGSSETLDAANSVPLATMPWLRERPEATTTLRPGSTLLLYTDGLIEHRGESLADGMHRARTALLDLRTVAPGPLATQLVQRLLGQGHEDDVAYLIYQHPQMDDVTVAAGEVGTIVRLRKGLR